MAGSKIWNMLDGYESNRDSSGLEKKFFSRDVSLGAGSARVKSHSRIAQFSAFVINRLTYTKSKVYGASALTFGLLTLVIHFFKDYFGLSGGVSTSALVVGAVFSAIAVLLLLFDKPVPIVLQDSPLLEFVFFEFFCIQRVHRGTGESSFGLGLAITLGALLGGSTYFVHPLYIAMGICTVLFTIIAFRSPEFAFFTSLLLLPYLSYIPNSFAVFSFTVILAAVSFARKVACGKRVFSFEQYDILILLLMAMILISGIFIKGMESFTSSAALCIMSLGYFLTSNIITNRRLADRAMNAIAVSSVIPSLMSIGAAIAKLADGASLSGTLGIRATFESTDLYAAFLAAALCFSVALAKQTHAPLKKIFYFLNVFLNLVALVLTGEIFCIAALIIGVAAYFACKSGRLAPLLLTLLFILPYLIHLLPDSFLNKVYDLIPSSPDYNSVKNTLLASLKLFSNNFVFGVGMGTDSFASEIKEYGITAQNSGNLFLELALEAGAMALVCFMLLIVVRLRHRVRYRPYIKNSVFHNSHPSVSAAIFALLSYGSFCYLFSDVTMMYFFFVVFGIESGMLRVARHECDERALYYLHSRADDSSEIDVYLEQKDKNERTRPTK